LLRKRDGFLGGVWREQSDITFRAFVENVKALFGFRAKGRDVVEGCGGYQLRESAARYEALFEAENDDIALENTHFWEIKAG
jgi:hypothetical protein